VIQQTNAIRGFYKSCDPICFVQEVYEKRTVHRAVKSDNMMITRGQAKIMDFGHAKLLEKGR
jgi:serine/threonine protein kinase